MTSVLAQPRLHRHTVRLQPPDPHDPDSRGLRMLSYRLRVFDRVLADIVGPANGRSYLDLGAGHLLFARRARDAGFRVTAVDARPPWGDATPTGITIQQADIRDFDTAGFDVIGLVGLLYHLGLDDQVAMLRRCGGRPTVVDTEVWCPEVVAAHGLASSRVRQVQPIAGITGAMLTETDDLWSSYGNRESFWPTEDGLHRMMGGMGWTRLTAIDPPYLSRFGRRRWYVLQ